MLLFGRHWGERARTWVGWTGALDRGVCTTTRGERSEAVMMSDDFLDKEDDDSLLLWTLERMYVGGRSWTLKRGRVEGRDGDSKRGSFLNRTHHLC